MPRIRSPYLSAAAVGFIAVLLGLTHAWTADDGFITFRVARNIAEGHGPVYNIGERVEASTSPLWTWLMGLCSWIASHSLETLSASLGIAFASGGLVLMMRGCSRALDDRRMVLPGAVIVLLGLRSFWEFETSGLDISLTIFWVGLSWWALARVADLPETRRRTLGAAALLGLAPLVRAELVLPAIVILITLLRRRRNQWCLSAAVFLVPGLVYEIFRAAYYATLVPTTALAKEGSRLRWDFVGVHYVWVSLILSLACVPALGVAWLHRRRTQSGRTQSIGELAALRRAFVIGGLVEVAYVTAVGGDYMIGRLLLPGVALMVAPYAVLRVERTQALPTMAVLTALTLIPAFTQPHLLPNPHDNFGTKKNWLVQEARYLQYETKVHRPYRLVDFGQSYVMRDLARSYDLYGRLAEPDGRFERLPDAGQQSVVTTSILGITGYVLPSAVYVVDLNGLADPVSARLKLDRRGRPGHEKRIGDGFAQVRFGTRAPSGPPGAKACAQIRRLYRDIRGPLSAHRMWHNLLDAFGNTTMRIRLNDNDAVCAPNP